MELIDFILNVDVYLGSMIENFGSLSYGILFAIVFAETGFVLTPFLPGDSLLFASGMFAGVGALNITVLFFTIWAASFLGDNVNYWVGYHFGKKIVNNHRIPINQNHIDKTEVFFKEHGRKAIFFARFMPIIRTFAPFVAGVGKMEYKKFVAFSLAGGFTWVISFILLGYFFGNMPIVKDNFSLVILFIIFVSVAPTIFNLLKAKLQKKA
ncbi:MAG: Protein DedA [uncultured bacterium]|nr:MAG: Protein DedA [uncultured bacterium]